MCPDWTSYLPLGPQTSVPITNIANIESPWMECYKQSFNDFLDHDKLDQEIQTSCCRDKVMMACKEKDSTELKVLAWAPRDDVFGLTDDTICGTSGTFGYTYSERVWRGETRETAKTAVCDQEQCQRGICEVDTGSTPKSIDYSKPNCGDCKCNVGGSCEGKVSNGVRWYQTDGDKGTWGFASEDSHINLYWVDVASDKDDDKRLSLHLNDNGAFEGGYRCGTRHATYNVVDGTSFDDDDRWELIFYHAN